MAEENHSKAFNNIDHKNKAIPVANTTKINDIDLTGSIYDNIINSAENSTVDLTSINSFTSISQSRDDVYNMIDIMAEDPTISTALNIYTADACEPNEAGNIVWAESDDEKVLGMVTYLLDQMNVDKNSYGWVHSLIKYGDLYLRLLRNSEYNLGIFDKFEKENNTLNEAINIKAFAKDDHYSQYLEKQPNPAEVFDLQRFGKTVGYIKTNIITKNMGDVMANNYNTLQQYNFNQGDIDIFPATDYVHACIEDHSSRLTEEVNISTDEENKANYTYNVKRGQSILYNLFRIWRELSLLENSVLLNRITKSSIIRYVNVEVGDMEKSDVRTLLHRVKSMMEQKAAINKNGGTYEDYTNPGPVENTLYIPVHDGKGAISTGEIGGQMTNDDLNDVNYFRTKVFSGLAIPKQYLGYTDDATGFNGGTSLSLISSQYAKNVKKIQNAYLQALTDAVNLFLIDKGLTSYVNKFVLKMQSPTTQEEKDRKENVSSTIRNISDIMGLLGDIEDVATRLKILKSLLSTVVTDPDVITYLQNEIDNLEETPEEEVTEEDDEDMASDFDEFEEPSGGMEPMTTEEPEESPEMSAEEPAEGFNNNSGELLNEENNLPSWNDLNMSYMDLYGR